MRWFRIDINKLIVKLMPIAFRRLRQITWLKVLLSPFSQLVAETLYTMQHNCQRIYMEKLLNEHFQMLGYDPLNHEATKVIWIGDGEQPNSVWIFQETEGQPIWLPLESEVEEETQDPIYLHTSQEMNEQYCDYRVYVPETVYEMMDELVYLIEYYNPFGKEYKIVMI